MIYPIKHLVAHLVERREALHLSQREVARRIGRPQSHVAKIEGGRRDLRTSTLIEFARALELELFLVPREKIPAVKAAISLTADQEAPPLTGGDW